MTTCLGCQTHAYELEYGVLTTFETETSKSLTLSAGFSFGFGFSFPGIGGIGAGIKASVAGTVTNLLSGALTQDHITIRTATCDKSYLLQCYSSI